MFGGKKEFWEYIFACLRGEVNALQSTAVARTPLGKGRAFIRWALKNKDLAELIQTASMNVGNTRDFYGDGAILRNEALLSRLLDSLYHLSEVNFTFAPLVAGLDTAWPNAAATASVPSTPIAITPARPPQAPPSNLTNPASAVSASAPYHAAPSTSAKSTSLSASLASNATLPSVLQSEGTTEVGDTSVNAESELPAVDAEQIQSLHVRLSALEVEYATATQRIIEQDKVLLAAKTKSATQMASLEAQLSALADEKAAVAKEAQHLQHQFHDREKRLARLQEEHDKLNRLFEDIEGKLITAEDKLSDDADRLAELESGWLQQLETETARHSQRIAFLESELAAKNRALAVAEADLSTSRSGLLDASAASAANGTDYSRQRSELVSMKDQLSTAQDRIKELKAAVIMATQTAEEMRNMASKSEDSAVRLVALLNEKTAQQQRLRDLEEQCNTASLNIERLTGDLLAQQSGEQQRVQQLEAEMAAIKIDLHRLTEENQTLLQEKSSFESKAVQLADELHTLVAAHASTLSSADHLKAELEKQSADYAADSEIRLTETSQRVETMQARIAELEASNNDLVSKVESSAHDVTLLRGQVEDFESETRAAADAEELRAKQLAEADDRIQQLEKETADLRAAVQQGIAQAVDRESVLESLRTESNTTQAEVVRVKCVIEDLQQAALTASAQHRADLTAWQERYQTADDALASEKQSYAAVKAELQQVLDRTTADLVEAKSKLQTQETSAVSLQETIAGLETVVRAKSKECDDVRSQLSSQLAAVIEERTTLSSTAVAAERNLDASRAQLFATRSEMEGISSDRESLRQQRYRLVEDIAQRDAAIREHEAAMLSAAAGLEPSSGDNVAIGDISSQLKGIFEQALSGKDIELAKLRSDLLTAEQSKAAVQSEVAILKENARAAAAQLGDLESKLASLQEETQVKLLALVTQVAELQATGTAAKAVADSLKVKLDSIQESLRRAELDKSALKSEADAASARAKELEGDFSAREKHFAEERMTLLGRLETSNLEHKSLSQQRLQLETANSELVRQAEQSERTMQFHLDKAQQIEVDFVQAKQSLSSAEGQIAELQERLASAHTAYDASIFECRAANRNLDVLVRQLFVSLSDSQSNLQQLHVRTNTVEQSIGKLDALTAKVLNASHLVSQTGSLVHDLKQGATHVRTTSSLRIAQLETELARSHGDLGPLREQVSALESEKQSLLAKLSSSEEQLSSSASVAADLQAELTEAQSSCSSFVAERDRLQATLSEEKSHAMRTAGENEGLKTALTDMEQALSAAKNLLQSSTLRLSDELEQTKRDLQAERDAATALRTQLTEANDSVSALTSLNTDLSKKLSESQSQVAALDEFIRSKDQEVLQLRSNLELVQTAKVQVESNLAEKQQKIAAHLAANESLTDEVTNLRKTISEVEATNASLETSEAVLRSRFDAQSASLASSERSLDTAQKEAAGLRDELHTLIETFSKTEEALARARSDKAALQANITSREQSLEDAQSALTRSRVDVDALRATETQLSGRLSTLESEMKVKSLDFLDSQQALATAKRTKDEAESTNQQLSEQLLQFKLDLQSERDAWVLEKTRILEEKARALAAVRDLEEKYHVSASDREKIAQSSRSELAAAQDQIRTLEGRCKALETEVDNRNVQLRLLKESHIDLNAMLTRHRDESAASRIAQEQQLAYLQKALIEAKADAESRVQEAVAASKAKSRATEDTEARLAELQAAIESAHAAEQALNADLDLTREEADRWKATCETRGDEVYA